MNPIENGPEQTEVDQLFEDSAFKGTAKAFVALGFPPAMVARIAVDTITVNGFLEIVHDENGKQILNDAGYPLVEEHKWDSLSDALGVLEILLAERRNVSRGASQ